MTIAVIGTGLMGAPMAGRLIAAGFDLIVYNRSAGRTDALEAQGARVAPTAAEAMAPADTIIVMVTDAHAVAEVLLATPESALALRASRVVQMGTIAPDESRELAQRVAAQGGRYLEAPVLGSIPEAESGRLIVMAGGEQALFDELRPILELFGPSPRLVGAVGQAAAIKLAFNQLIASLTAAFSLSVGLVQREGVEVELFMELLRGSALYAPTFDKKLDRLLARRFDTPNFPLRHLLKDVHLIERVAMQRGLNSDALTAVREILEAAWASDQGDSDYSAMFERIVPSERHA